MDYDYSPTALISLWGPRAQGKWFFEMLSTCFKVKAPVYLDKDTIVGHLGMNIFEDYTSV